MPAKTRFAHVPPAGFWKVGTSTYYSNGRELQHIVSGDSHGMWHPELQRNHYYCGSITHRAGMDWWPTEMEAIDPLELDFSEQPYMPFIGVVVE